MPASALRCGAPGNARRGALPGCRRRRSGSRAARSPAPGRRALAPPARRSGQRPELDHQISVAPVVAQTPWFSGRGDRDRHIRRGAADGQRRAEGQEIVVADELGVVACGAFSSISVHPPPRLAYPHRRVEPRRRASPRGRRPRAWPAPRRSRTPLPKRSGRRAGCRRWRGG